VPVKRSISVVFIKMENYISMYVFGRERDIQANTNQAALVLKLIIEK